MMSTTELVAVARQRRASEGIFLGVSALLFAASAAGTIYLCGTMSDGMEMPGGWTMSMAWMRMPGQSWALAASAFLGMWVVMMTAMMMPSQVPMLSRYRRAVAGTARLDLLTGVAGTGYFFVWSLFGIAIYLLGVTLATIEMQYPALARAVPIVAGAVVVAAGALQFTRWKSRHLGCCREMPARSCVLAPDAATAWRYGMRLGLHCSQCCAGPVAILLVLGVMDPLAMALVTGAITVERLTGERVGQTIGAAVVGAGLYLMGLAAGIG